jgi:hypothetical protein
VKSRCVVIFIVKIIVHLYGKRAGLVAEILLERGEISLTGMEISPYKHSQAGYPGCRDESSKIPPQAIFN